MHQYMGIRTLEEKSLKSGSKEFFNESDSIFLKWNKPLHSNKAFSKIFNYNKFAKKNFRNRLWIRVDVYVVGSK